MLQVRVPYPSISVTSVENSAGILVICCTSFRTVTRWSDYRLVLDS
jgi:hypothetical protein